jgi:hypothetical protein
MKAMQFSTQLYMHQVYYISRRDINTTPCTGWCTFYILYASATGRTHKLPICKRFQQEYRTILNLHRSSMITDRTVNNSRKRVLKRTILVLPPIRQNFTEMKTLDGEYGIKSPGRNTTIKKKVSAPYTAVYCHEANRFE